MHVSHKLQENSTNHRQRNEWHHERQRNHMDVNKLYIHACAMIHFLSSAVTCPPPPPCLTLVVRIQMQSILNFQQNIFQPQLSCSNTQLLVALLLSVTSFCLLFFLLSSSSLSPQALSPPSLVSSPPVLSSEQSKRTSPQKQKSTRKHGSCPAAPQPALLFSSCCLCFMAAGSHILTSNSAWLRICMCTNAERAAHTRGTDKQTCRDRCINAYTLVCSQSHTQTHTHTPLCWFIRSVSVWHEWGLD